MSIISAHFRLYR